jgi:hypothetical protein
MKIICSVTFCLITALVSANASLAKEWRGVAPLHSTRADVERLLGVPKQSTPYAFYYSLPDEIAVIWFQPQSCESDLFGLGWNVPIGTVTNIGVIPKANYHKEKFLNGTKFKVQDANAGFFYYTDETEGLSVETFNGIVTSLEYTPMEKEDNRRCPRVQECCVDFFPRFDEYGNLSLGDEKARLDNYAIVMKERLNRGVIVVYGRSRNERGKIMKRAERAKKYLTQKHGIEAQRILIVDGGYRERSATELNLHTIGGLVSRVYLFPELDPEERNKKRQ